jgi:hypothetical protein
LAFAHALFPSSPRDHIAGTSIIHCSDEDTTLDQCAVGVSEIDKLNDLARLLASLWETARRLPEGKERENAFMQIEGFQRRVAALVARAA